MREIERCMECRYGCGNVTSPEYLDRRVIVGISLLWITKGKHVWLRGDGLVSS